MVANSKILTRSSLVALAFAHSLTRVGFFMQVKFGDIASLKLA